MTEPFGYTFLSENVNEPVLGLRADLTGPRVARDLPQVTLYVISELDSQIWLLLFKTENALFQSQCCVFCLPGHLGNFSLFLPIPSLKNP